MPPNQKKSDLYEQMQPFVQKEIEAQYDKLYDKIASQYAVAQTPLHVHNGSDAPQITQSNILPGIRASAFMAFAADGTYTLGLPANAVMLFFHGIMQDNFSAGTGICTGMAFLGKSYEISATGMSDTLYTTSGPVQNITQSYTTLFVTSMGQSGSLGTGSVVNFNGLTVTVSEYQNGFATLDAVVPAGMFLSGTWMIS